MAYPQDFQVTDVVQSDSQTYNNEQVLLTNSAAPHALAVERSLEEVRMSAMLAESGDSTTHIISPAIVDDNEELDSYLSSNPAVGLRRITRTSSTGTNMGPPSRRVLFSTVLRKPLGINANQSIAAGKLEIIEKLLEPHVADMIDLFFENVNVCFPILDEASFRRTYTEHKDRLSCALLANLYANAMTYWKNSPRLRSCHPPDQRYIWVQANEALHSELFLSPGISTVISIVLNVHGRPSTSMFGNGGMVGTAVALSNSLGLNRDCSAWNISPEEKAFRFRIWSIVVLMDRWTSLAYGTPLLIHRAQYDVAVPSKELLAQSRLSTAQHAGLSIFLAMLTLTGVLSRYLEHVYHISRVATTNPSSVSPFHLEMILADWEDTLEDDIRRLVLRGNDLDRAGAANLRLSYLAVKLLFRRILCDTASFPSEPEKAAQARLQTQRVAEEIVLLVQELKHPHLSGFWMPMNGFTLTSATLFLLRDALKATNKTRNTSLKLAKDMIACLQTHRTNEAWDLADDCLANCTEMTDKIEAGRNSEPSDAAEPQYLVDNDSLMFNDAVLGFASAFDFDLQNFQWNDDA
ncbi:hypothetical protein KCU77_g2749, partial [Aureobasidium melanogenum]